MSSRFTEQETETYYDSEDAEHYEWLSNAYQETAKAVDNQELGWGLFVCQK